jgi:hypothetical protein
MKKYAWKVALAVTALAAIAACSSEGLTSARGLNSATGPSPVASAQGVASSQAADLTVSGNAVITQMPGVVYRQIINARKTSDGEVSGTMTVHLLDLSGFGDQDTKGSLVGRVRCLDFDADSVWFGVTIEAASDKAFLDPMLTDAIGQVRVVNGQSYGFSGPAIFYVPPGTKCNDRPALPITPVTEGHYTIR